MSNPTASDSHVNAVLTNVSLAILQSAAGFVADRVFPVVPVQKQSDRYYTYDKDDFNRDEMEVRAPGTESAGSQYNVDNTPTYYAPVYALHKDIPDQVRANSDSVLNVDRDTTTFLTLKSLIKKEVIFATKYLAPSVWATEYTGVTSAPTGNQRWKWSDANSDPIIDVRTASRAILERTGIKPNKFVIGKKAYDTLLDHPDVIDRIKYGQTAGGPAMTTRAALAALFEVDSVEVMEAIVNASKYGVSASTAFINGNNALLTYAAPNPGLMTPTAGYTFSWTGLMGSNAMAGRIKQIRMEHLESDRLEIQQAFDMKLVAADLGAFFNGIV